MIEYEFRRKPEGKNQIKYVAIEGVIGAGKTTLATKFSEKLKAELIIEQFDENPFLEKFYRDMRRFAFQTQLFFLVNRFKQLEYLQQENLFREYIITDYIFEKDRIFALLNLDIDELKLYESIFPMLQKNLIQPDLVVYLKSSVDRLMHNIEKRNRSFEKNIERSYIEKLSKAYDEYFLRYSTTPLLIVNASEIDFVNNKTDFDALFEIIIDERKKRQETVQD